MARQREDGEHAGADGFGFGLRGGCQLQTHAPNTPLMLMFAKWHQIQLEISCNRLSVYLEDRTRSHRCFTLHLTKQLLKSCSFAPERACDAMNSVQFNGPSWGEGTMWPFFLPLWTSLSTIDVPVRTVLSRFARWVGAMSFLLHCIEWDLREGKKEMGL